MKIIEVGSNNQINLKKVPEIEQFVINLKRILKTKLKTVPKPIFVLN